MSDESRRLVRTPQSRRQTLADWCETPVRMDPGSAEVKMGGGKIGRLRIDPFPDTVVAREPWRYTEPDWSAPPGEDAMRQAVRRAFDAEVKRRDDAVARALWAGATDSEREALREQLADDLRSGRVTADEARASFAPDRIKAAEDANVAAVGRWLSADAGIYHLRPEPRDVMTQPACSRLLRALGAPVRPPERTRGPSLYDAACKSGRERRPAPVVAPEHNPARDLAGVLRVDPSKAGIRDEVVDALANYEHGDPLPWVAMAGISHDEQAFVEGVLEDAQERHGVVVPDLGVPSTMGHLRAMGSRPLCTVADGPRYDFGEVP